MTCPQIMQITGAKRRTVQSFRVQRGLRAKLHALLPVSIRSAGEANLGAICIMVATGDQPVGRCFASGSPRRGAIHIRPLCVLSPQLQDGAWYGFHTVAGPCFPSMNRPLRGLRILFAAVIHGLIARG